MNNRQEQIEQAKRLIATGISKDLAMVLYQQFPELKESEDERIREGFRRLLNGIRRDGGLTLNKVPLDKCFAYLEKQKDKRELDFAEGKVEGVKQTCQEIKDAMSLFEPKDLTPFELTFRDYIDSAIRYCLAGEGYQQYIKEWAADLLNLEKQKEQKPAEWKPQPESLEALMYAIEGKWEMIKPTSYLSRRLEDLYDGLVNTFDVDESLVVHENDFVSKPANATQTDANKNANAEWTEEDDNALNYIHELISFGFTENFMDAQTAADMREWLNTQLKSIRPNPKQEWSKEDEKVLCEIIWNINAYDAYTGTIYQNPKHHDRKINFLKTISPQSQRKDTYYDIIHSILATLKDVDFTQITPEHRVSLLNDIRVKCKNADECTAILDEPHWKPSEEQMKHLERCFSHGYTSQLPNQHVLESLYHDLQRLF